MYNLWSDGIGFILLVRPRFMYLFQFQRGYIRILYISRFGFHRFSVFNYHDFSVRREIDRNGVFPEFSFDFLKIFSGKRIGVLFLYIKYSVPQKRLWRRVSAANAAGSRAGGERSSLGGVKGSWAERIPIKPGASRVCGPEWSGAGGAKGEWLMPWLDSG